MKEVTTIGVDLAKNVFQVHGVDMEACATAHHWARQLIELGHEVKLMPPNYVKPYVKRNKNDAADAAAICEAVTRPTMRFGAVKSAEQQSVLMLHRTRELLVRQRTMLVNAIRAHMAEFGIVAPVGIPRVKELFAVIADADDDRLPPIARACLEGLAKQFMSLHEEIAIAERRIHDWHRSNEARQRLETIPGIGPLTATALAGAMTIIRHAKRRGTSNLPWLANLIASKPTKVAAVALANKMARTAWVLLRTGQDYQKPALTHGT